jgi:hypothetical protein
MIRDEQGIVADIATQVVGKLSGSYSRGRIAFTQKSFAVILHRLYLPFAQRHRRLFSLFRIYVMSNACQTDNHTNYERRNRNHT